MNKASKIIVLVMLLVIFAYLVVTMILPKLKNGDGDINKESGDVSSEIDADSIKYSVEKLSENEIGLIVDEEEMKIVTKYVFEEDVLKDIYVVQELLSGDSVEDFFDIMTAEEEISQIYDDVKLEGNVITMKLKQEYVDVYAGVKYEDLYAELINSLNASTSETLDK